MPMRARCAPNAHTPPPRPSSRSGTVHGAQRLLLIEAEMTTLSGRRTSDVGVTRAHSVRTSDRREAGVVLAITGTAVRPVNVAAGLVTYPESRRPRTQTGVSLARPPHSMIVVAAGAIQARNRRRRR